MKAPSYIIRSQWQTEKQLTQMRAAATKMMLNVEK